MERLEQEQEERETWNASEMSTKSDNISTKVMLHCSAHTAVDVPYSHVLCSSTLWRLKSTNEWGPPRTVKLPSTTKRGGSS